MAFAASMTGVTDLGARPTPIPSHGGRARGLELLHSLHEVIELLHEERRILLVLTRGVVAPRSAARGYNGVLQGLDSRHEFLEIIAFY